MTNELRIHYGGDMAKDKIKFGLGEQVAVKDLDKWQLRAVVQVLLDYFDLNLVVKSLSSEGPVLGLVKREK